MRKQLDPRIPILINNNVKKNHRSFIVLVGDKGRDQVRKRFLVVEHIPECMADCELAFLVVASPCLGATIRTLVLQEGSWVHKVRT